MRVASRNSRESAAAVSRQRVSCAQRQLLGGHFQRTTHAAYVTTTVPFLPQRTAASGQQRADSSERTAAASDSRAAWAQMQPSSSSSSSSAASSASASAARRAARMAVRRDIEASASTRAACAHSARSRLICAGVWGDSWWMCSPLAGGTLYRRRVTQPSHDTDSYRPTASSPPYAAGRPSHILEADPSHSQPHLRLSRAATTRARRHPRRAAPMAADAPLLQCVRLSTGARRYLEHSMSLARAATRSRRSDRLQHPSRLEPHRPPSRRYTCADRQATRSCGRH